MKYRLEIRPDALNDIAAAGDWYEAREPGLGREFAQVLRSAIMDLTRDPKIYRIRHHRFRVRWFYPPRFPYRIVYRVEDDLMTILAVIHAARHDRQWLDRA